MKKHNMKNAAIPAFALISLGALGIAGCTPSARQDVSNAGSDIGSATTKSVDATGKVIGDAGTAVKDSAVNAGKDAKAGADKAVQGTEKAVVNTGKDIKNGADAAAAGTEKAVVNAGTAIKNGTDNAVQGTEKAVAKAGSDAKTSTAVLTLTPKVKAAILKDDSVNISELNIDTHGDTKQVVVQGTAPTAAAKSKAMADAKQAMAGDTSGYTLVDQLKVGK